jgi:uncharacterized protein YegP (UPF0339 family)
MAGVFEINRRAGGGFGFNVKAANDQVVLSSQGYETKASCRKGIESVRKHSTDEANQRHPVSGDERADSVDSGSHHLNATMRESR